MNRDEIVAWQDRNIAVAGLIGCVDAAITGVRRQPWRLIRNARRLAGTRRYLTELARLADVNLDAGHALLREHPPGG